MADGSTLPGWLDRVPAFFRKRRLAREERVIATAEYTTTSEAGAVLSTHILVLAVDGNGDRYERVETTHQKRADAHNALIRHRMDWVHHAVVPQHATRVRRHGGANLVLLNGGGPDAA